jgi:hypothetical protein
VRLAVKCLQDRRAARGIRRSSPMSRPRIQTTGRAPTTMNDTSGPRTPVEAPSASDCRTAGAF